MDEQLARKQYDFVLALIQTGREPAAKLLESNVVPTHEAERLAATAHLTLTDTTAPNRLRTSLQLMVAVPYQVDIPLRRRSEEVCFPSISGLDLIAGKV